MVSSLTGYNLIFIEVLCPGEKRLCHFDLLSLLIAKLLYQKFLCSKIPRESNEEIKQDYVK